MGNFICIIILSYVMSGFLVSLLQQQVIQERIVRNIQTGFIDQLDAENALQKKIKTSFSKEYKVGYIPDDLTYACPHGASAYKINLPIGDKEYGRTLQTIIAMR
jgi:hypothetical protein